MSKFIKSAALIAVFGLAAAAQAHSMRDAHRLMRMECTAEMMRSDKIKIRLYTYTQERNGRIDRDVDVFRCRLAGTDMGRAAYRCGNSFVPMVYLDQSAPGRALFRNDLIAINGFRAGTHSCMLTNVDYIVEEGTIYQQDGTYQQQGKPEIYQQSYQQQQQIQQQHQQQFQEHQQH